MKKYLLLFLLLINTSISYAQIIDVKCEYNLSEPLFEDKTDEWVVDYVAMDKDEKSEHIKSAIQNILNHPFTLENYRYAWWILWNNKNIIYFSIDEKTKQVTGGFFESKDGLTFKTAVATIYPDYIMIKEEADTADGYKHMLHQYSIQRFDGSFSGSHYTTDSKTHKDIEEYSMNGKCVPIKRLF